MFGVNRQVYYRAIKAEKHKQEIANQVVTLVRGVRMRQPELGTRKLYVNLHTELKELGIGRDKLYTILKANHLLIKPKKQYHITTNSHHRFRKHKNLTEGLILTRPEQLWVSDITYIGTREKPMYLSLVTDAYSKLIVGYDVSASLHTCGVKRALQMAIKKRIYPKETLIHHSDRGLQYCSNDYQKTLNKSRIKCSMTEKYDPYQNAVAERINGILKQEFIRGITVKDLELMKMIIAQSVYIYNHERPHWSCYMKTPIFMHQQRKIKIRTYKTKISTKENLSAN